MTSYPKTAIDDLLDEYVLRVVKRLSRRRRRDVAVELRSLLREELDARTPEAGEDDVRALLEEFGRPADVAARYQPPPAIIDPADARQFVRLAVGGVLVSWLVGLVAVVGAHSGESAAVVAQRWWWGVALPALWWPGFLVVCFAGAAQARRRWPALDRWHPRSRDRDRISRAGYAAATAYFILGTVILIAPAHWLDVVSGGRAAPAALDAFAYDEDFLQLRGPLVLAFIVANLALQIAVLVQGRWQPLTRRVSVGLAVPTCVLLVWVASAGDIFRAAPTDDLVKLCLVLIALGMALGGAVRLARRLRRVPATPARSRLSRS